LAVSDAVELAVGRWPGILAKLGVPSTVLTGKHGPCPSCGGKDRFRFTDKDGQGRWICNQCGNGSGFDLLGLVHGWDFKRAAQEVKAIVGDVPLTGIRQEATPEDIRRRLRCTFRRSTATKDGDLVSSYLRSRSLPSAVKFEAIRFAPSLPVDGDEFPAMLAVVSDAAGKPATLHRTFLARDGSGKAPIRSPRRLMPGKAPMGGAVRLGEHVGRLGIAEGIETAMAASVMFGLPVWSAVSSAMLSGWVPPDDAVDIVIFGDNDPLFGGQSAAYTLAHRLAVGGNRVEVRIPPAGDWNDELIRRSA
jgi:putative DNA primase/helicase